MKRVSMFTVIAVSLWVGICWAQNYRVLDRVQIGSDTDQATVIFDVLQSRQVTYSFGVHCPNDVALDVTAITGPNSLPVQYVDKFPDPNGWMAIYQFTFVPPRGTVYVDITATDTTGTCQPTILKGTGLASIPYWYPHAEAWLADRAVDPNDKLDVWQRARAIVARNMTERELNDALFLAWTQGKVKIP